MVVFVNVSNRLYMFSKCLKSFVYGSICLSFSIKMVKQTIAIHKFAELINHKIRN